MARGLTAAQITDKQVAAVSAATTAYTTGVRAVQTAPGALAAQHQDKYLAGVQANVGKWAQHVAAVSLTDWQNAAVTKGAPRLGSGITAAKPKITAFWNRFLPYLQQVQQSVSQMPTTTFDQRIAKMVASATQLHNFSMTA